MNLMLMLLYILGLWASNLTSRASDNHKTLLTNTHSFGLVGPDQNFRHTNHRFSFDCFAGFVTDSSLT